MHVIVIGSGIGGVTTALALASNGFDVTILERAPEISEVGAGIWLHGNAVRILDRLGVAHEVRRTGVEAHTADWRNLYTDENFYGFDLAEAGKRYGTPGYFVYRADLLNALLGGLPSSVSVRLNAEVIEVRPTPGGATVITADNQELSADVVLAADGLRSRVREQLFASGKPRPVGHVGHRIVLPQDRVAHLGLDANTFYQWTGSGHTVVAYEMHEHKLLNFVAFVPSDEITASESWTAPGNLDDLRRSLHGACATVQSLLNLMEGSTLLSELYWREQPGSWANGHVALVGDAAHPAPPFLGAGTAMAIEDAASVAGCLARAHSGEAIPDLLVEYGARRAPRADNFQTISRANVGFLQERDPAMEAIRDARYSSLRRIDPAGITYWEWLWAHDAEAGLEAAPQVSTPAWTRRESQRAADRWRNALNAEDRAGGWVGERKGYERFTQALPVHSDVTWNKCTLAGVGAETVTPSILREGAPEILHFHGGGYNYGSAKGSRGLASRIAAATSARVTSIDYRLAPEHPAPAALEDAIDAYLQLSSRSVTGVYLTGEGSGAGLALALAQHLRDAGHAAPVGMLLVSPQADLTKGAQSLPPTDSEAWALPVRLSWWAAGVCCVIDATDPRVSPLLGNLSDVPAMLLFTASGETLADDARRLAQGVTAAGGTVDFEVIDDSVHAFILFDDLPESTAALQKLADVVQRLDVQYCSGLRSAGS